MERITHLRLTQTHVEFVFLLFVLLQVLDVLSTHAFLDAGIGEWNPIISFIFEQQGLSGVLLIKLSALLALKKYLDFRCVITDRILLLRTACVLSLAICAHNTTTLYLY